MRRREFIAGLGGAAAWPMVARGQQLNRLRRVGVMVSATADEPRTQADLAAFRERLQELGWTVGRNLQIDIHWSIYDVERARAATAELLGRAADVIVTNGTAPLKALQQATRTTPVVFTVVYEPVAQGFVQSLAHPGGNITGFANVEPTVGGKWLELLKEIAPGVTRVGFVFNPEASPYSPTIYRSVEALASRFAVDTALVPVYEPAQIEPVMTRFGREPGGGLIFPPDAFLRNHRRLTVELAARTRLPAIYGYGERLFAAEGGLVSYGANISDQFRQAAGYVDRILRGEKPGNLPVQQPAKFELVINAKTAKTLDLRVSETLLATADEVIQ
jgi:putative tryptophan/tyrosine transport system substrate-binding protein